MQFNQQWTKRVQQNYFQLKLSDFVSFISFFYYELLVETTVHTFVKPQV